MILSHSGLIFKVHQLFPSTFTAPVLTRKSCTFHSLVPLLPSLLCLSPPQEIEGEERCRRKCLVAVLPGILCFIQFKTRYLRLTYKSLQGKKTTSSNRGNPTGRRSVDLKNALLARTTAGGMVWPSGLVPYSAVSFLEELNRIFSHQNRVRPLSVEFAADIDVRCFAPCKSPASGKPCYSSAQQVHRIRCCTDRN